MARYDRIARLKPPSRDEAFPGWSVLRDLEAAERDPDLGRRVRLRFLALRPVRRVLLRGFDGVSAGSYERQVDGIREELGHLSARDPERIRLAAFLRRIRERTPTALSDATVEMAEALEAVSQLHGAGEYARTALELAEAHGLDGQQVVALRVLARIARRDGRMAESLELARAAARLAEEIGDRHAWGEAMVDLAISARAQADHDGARRALRAILERCGEEEELAGLAAAEICLTELAAQEPGRAVEYGWRALRLVGDPALREALLDRLGTAFRLLDLPAAAARCYQLLAARASDPMGRAQALALLATARAELGDEEGYRRSRAQVLEALGDWQANPAAYALVHLDLAHGALLLEAVDAVRDHVREAIGRAQAHGLRDILARASELLSALEEAAADQPRRAAPRHRPPPTVRKIAAEIEALDEALVALTG